jgi:hypothetical protein
MDEHVQLRLDAAKQRKELHKYIYSFNQELRQYISQIKRDDDADYESIVSSIRNNSVIRSFLDTAHYYRWTDYFKNPYHIALVKIRFDNFLMEFAPLMSGIWDEFINGYSQDNNELKQKSTEPVRIDDLLTILSESHKQLEKITKIKPN